MNPRKKRRRSLTKAEIRAMGCAPVLMVVRYTPDGERATVKQLTPEAKLSPFLHTKPTLPTEKKNNERRA